MHPVPHAQPSGPCALAARARGSIPPAIGARRQCVALLLACAPALGATAGDDDAFGGGARAPDPTDEETVCTVQTDDGRWRPCAELLQRAATPTETAETAETAEEKALRDRMRALEDERAAPPPAPKTPLELEVERAGFDPTLPLLALRIEAARAEQRVALLEVRGRGGRALDEARAALDAVQAVLEDIEQVAYHRMEVCSVRRGNKPRFQHQRMTAGGAVPITPEERLAQLRLQDPEGCTRLLLIDAPTVERARRLHALRRTLATRSFGYREVAARRALEEEVRSLEEQLARDAGPVLGAPGIRDPSTR